MHSICGNSYFQTQQPEQQTIFYLIGQKILLQYFLVKDCS